MALIRQARARLGPGPLRALFEAVVRPLATPATCGAWYRGLRLVAIDGATLDVPDTAENEDRFGRPGSARRAGGGAFPQVRLVGVGECGTHALFAPALGSFATAETALAGRVLPALGPGMLVLAFAAGPSADGPPRWYSLVSAVQELGR